MPPYLAGREHETSVFRELLRQSTVMQNLVLTGLRGVGRTVLLETFKPIAQQAGWLWVGTDMSEAASLTDERMATRLLTDLSVRTAAITLSREVPTATFLGKASEHQRLDYGCLTDLHGRTPGLHADKLKAVLEFAWECFRRQRPPVRGLIFAYDEAQTLADNAADKEYPLSMMLDVFQSIQKKGVPFMLVLTGLPTLFPKLVEARTFAERMFRVVFLDHLTRDETGDAIRRPIAAAGCPLRLSDQGIDNVYDLSGGYPYFIQFVCRELYDSAIQNYARATSDFEGTFREIVRKLDCDFFSGRWARVTDRQRDILVAIAHLPNCHTEFSVQEVVEVSGRQLAKGFSASRVSQLMLALSEAGLVYKNRHGRYAFAVPMLGPFILRQVG
ncbi:MAG: hypothetical protein K2X87_28600 [Gemmataceae bacterium]|nr:hypothetical protein [Gemmataceae bacterium]